MTLHEAMLNDVPRVFLNLREFGERIRFDGHSMVALIDDGHDTREAGSGDGFSNASMLSLMQVGRLLRMEDCLPVRPVPGQRVNIDGEIWQVDDGEDAVIVETGILCLKLHKPYA